MLELAVFVAGFIAGVSLKGYIDGPEFDRISSDNHTLRDKVDDLRLKLDKHETWDPSE